MDNALKILHLEDLVSDAELVYRELKKSGLNFERKLVSNKKDFVEALEQGWPDIIISDHSLPSFDSTEALSIVKEMNIDVPFILVTATVSEEYAVSIIKMGASDYILKDRLQRLPNAVTGAINKHKLEIAYKKADSVLRASEQKYKLLFHSNPMPMWMVARRTGRIIDVNDAAIEHYGYAKNEFLAMKADELETGYETAQLFGLSFDTVGLHQTDNHYHKTKRGTVIIVEVIANELLHDSEPVTLILANDITEKRKAEGELAHQQQLQKKLITENSIQVQEKEREEIGKELHDNINQILAATKLYLDLAIKEQDDILPELLYKSLNNITLAMKEIRLLSQTLVAPSLGSMTLIQAVTELMNNIGIASSLKLDLKTEDYTEEKMDQNIKLMFYRIIQEQINNILKHSKAKHATVVLKTSPEKLVLTVKDDGIGFDTKKSPGGIGLRNISNRASFYNGVTRVQSNPGKGCVLEVAIPIQDKMGVVLNPNALETPHSATI